MAPHRRHDFLQCILDHKLSFEFVNCAERFIFFLYQSNINQPREIAFIYWVGQKILHVLQAVE